MREGICALGGVIWWYVYEVTEILGVLPWFYFPVDYRARDKWILVLFMLSTDRTNDLVFSKIVHLC
jgi:hypothetical protein